MFIIFQSSYVSLASKERMLSRVGVYMPDVELEQVVSEIERAVDEVNTRIISFLQKLDLKKLPSIPIDSLEACDKIPRGITCLYFVLHPSSLLYVGKAKDLRARWRAAGHVGEERQAMHGLHNRCIDVGKCHLSWLRLHIEAHEIVETLAIRVLHPAWNSRKTVTWKYVEDTP
jgi:hypothetical protein